mgnify:FL=1
MSMRPNTWEAENELIRVFIATTPDEATAKSDLVLEYTILKHASQPVEITWMRTGDDGWDDWNTDWGGTPKRGRWTMPFGLYRYAIPELMRFQGRAIYLDSDQMLFDDIAELYNQKLSAPWKCISNDRTDVSVINCAAFGGASWWPSLAAMKATPENGVYYRKILKEKGFIDPTLSKEWNSFDGDVWPCKLLHFTEIDTQPWKPWPTIQYRRHPRPDIVKLWKKTLEAAQQWKSSLQTKP